VVYLLWKGFFISATVITLLGEFLIVSSTIRIVLSVGEGFTLLEFSVSVVDLLPDFVMKM
jgi:hypothetical protein